MSQFVHLFLSSFGCGLKFTWTISLLKRRILLCFCVSLSKFFQEWKEGGWRTKVIFFNKVLLPCYPVSFTPAFVSHSFDPGSLRLYLTCSSSHVLLYRLLRRSLSWMLLLWSQSKWFVDKEDLLPYNSFNLPVHVMSNSVAPRLHHHLLSLLVLLDFDSKSAWSFMFIWKSLLFHDRSLVFSSWFSFDTFNSLLLLISSSGQDKLHHLLNFVTQEQENERAAPGNPPTTPLMMPCLVTIIGFSLGQQSVPEAGQQSTFLLSWYGMDSGHGRKSTPVSTQT